MDLNQVNELAIKRDHTNQSTFPQNCYLTTVSRHEYNEEVHRHVGRYVLSRPKYFGRQCDINDIQL
jgi:hypothetical protein